MSEENLCLNSEAAPRPVARSNMKDGSSLTCDHLCLKLFCCCCPRHNLRDSHPIKLLFCPGCSSADKLASSAIHLSRWQISLRVSLSLFPSSSSNTVLFTGPLDIDQHLPTSPFSCSSSSTSSRPLFLADGICTNSHC